MLSKFLRSTAIVVAATASLAINMSAASAGGGLKVIVGEIRAPQATLSPMTKTVCTPVYERQCLNPYASPPFDLCLDVQVGEECRQVPL